MDYGNRGMAFEQLLNITCRMYKTAYVGVFNKRPTPVKVIKTNNKGEITKSAWGSKSTVITMEYIKEERFTSKRSPLKKQKDSR